MWCRLRRRMTLWCSSDVMERFCCLRLAWDGANCGIDQCLHWSMNAPPCGARKTLRACAFPCVFRPLRKLRFACICRRQRQSAIPPACSILIRISPNSFPKQNHHPLGWWFCFGGDGEIRTLEELLTPTRFPIVRARPTTRHLRVAQDASINLSALPL